MPRTAAVVPKHRQVYEALLAQIRAGDIPPGARLPSEAALGQRFSASRITVGRALRDLQLAGLIDRRVGSGSYVRKRRLMATGPRRAFGVLMPDLDDVEVFEGIRHGLAEAPESRPHTLVWGSVSGATEDRRARAWEAARQYIDLPVDGVFFAPLEHVPDQEEVNRSIAAAFQAAGIPLVLIDRTIEPYPHRSPFDLVGLDNRRAGALVTAHLLRAGSRRPAFLGLPGAASTVDAREAGFCEVLRQRVPGTPVRLYRADPDDAARVREWLDRDSVDGFVCASDRTAARLMRTLLELGIAIPRDVRLASIDDVDYASLLPVPLTTLRQPGRQIGAMAMGVMLERVARPDLPARDVLLHGTLIVRASCGAGVPTEEGRAG